MKYLHFEVINNVMQLIFVKKKLMYYYFKIEILQQLNSYIKSILKVTEF